MAPLLGKPLGELAEYLPPRPAVKAEEEEEDDEMPRGDGGGVPVDDNGREPNGAASAPRGAVATRRRPLKTEEQSAAGVAKRPRV